MFRGLTSIIFGLLILQWVQSCGFADNPRNSRSRSSIRNIFRQNTTLTGGGFQSLKREIDGLSVATISQPEVGEEIEYRVRFENKRSLNFNVPEGSCRFEYLKARVSETVISGPELTNILHIESKTVAEEPTYSGLPIESLKNKCLEAAPQQVVTGVRAINLSQSLDQYKKFLTGQILGLVNKCEVRGELTALGRCKNLRLNVKLEQEILFEAMEVYKIEASIELLSSKEEDKSFSIYMNLKRPYFAFFGLIHLNGILPEKSGSSDQDINSLEILRWTRN